MGAENKRISYSKEIELRVKQLRPMDDTFFTKLAEDISFCQEVLRVILQKEDLVIVSSMPQKVLRNVEARSVTVDVLCKDSEENQYNIEVQKQDNDDHQRRVRYNASNVDTYIVEKGIDFKDLPDVYVVYISSFDYFGAGKTIYHVERVLRETNEVVNNGVYEIYLNTQIDDGTDIAELMKLFKESDIPNDKRFPAVCNRIKYFKEGKGREEMCKIIEEYGDMKKAEGIEEGIRKNALKMLQKGTYTDEEIQEITELDLEEIQNMREAYLQLV